MAFAPSLLDSGRAVRRITAREATDAVVEHHYLHRAPPISFSFGLIDNGDLRGACTFGTPASRHLQMSACPSEPDNVIELNRLWVHDDEARNTESWFVTRCLRALPPLIVVSYADTAEGHVGYVYRALGWRYAGWTDMERRTPRLDYIPISGLHTRDAARSGLLETRRRTPKVRYWTTTGNRSHRRRLVALGGWPSLDWHEQPPPECTLRRPRGGD